MQNRTIPRTALATPAEAAAFLGISKTTVFVLLRGGSLTRVKVGPRTTRIPWPELHTLAGVHSHE
jgi:hypothetical protein